MSLLIFLSLLTNCIAIHLAHIYEFISVSVERHIMRMISDTMELTFKHLTPLERTKENSKDRLPLVITDPFFTSSHGGDKKI